MKISVGPESLAELLNGSTLLDVPSFQRNYSWRRDEIDQFLTDLVSSAKTGEPHFFGPIVFLREPHEPHRYQVIDGQQRLTSAMMLIALLRDHASGLVEKSFGSKGTTVDQLFRNLIFLPPFFEQPRFSASYLIDSVFSKFILDDPTSQFGGETINRPELSRNGKGLSQEDKNNTRDLRRTYWDMRKAVAKLFEKKKEADQKDLLLELFKAVSEGFQIHSMMLDNEDDAYVLFETLNDRGMRLSPSDLLKTITLREVRKHRPKELDEAIATWDSTVQNLGEYDFSKFLRHYLLTVESKPVQKPKILGVFRRRIAEGGQSGALQNLERLHASSALYAQLLGVDSEHPDSHVAAGVQRMNFYSDTHRVLLLSALEIQSKVDVKTLRKVFRATEYLSFRWIAALQNAQVLENHYQDLARELKKVKSDSDADAVIARMVELAPSDEKIGKFSEVDNTALQRYILRRIEESFGGHVPSWNERMSIEHLAPQNPRGKKAHYWFEMVPTSEDEAYSDIVSLVGNLTLLEKPLNSSIQDSDWNAKKWGSKEQQYEGISNSNFNLNKPLLEIDNWTRDHILSRSDWIHESALKLVGHDWIHSAKIAPSKWKPKVK